MHFDVFIDDSLITDALMYYKKINFEGLIIEFHSNWLGEETVGVNGQTVSKKSSIMGTDHYFSILENGSISRYILTSKLDASMSVFLDLRRNGQMILEDTPVPNAGMYRSTGRLSILSPYKISGLNKLKEYRIEEAIEDLNKALEKNPEDPEIYFHLACAYSIQEKALDGFECLRKAVSLNLNNRDMILSHDMLAYLRMHPAFETFQHSNYTTYDKALF